MNPPPSGESPFGLSAPATNPIHAAVHTMNAAHAKKNTAVDLDGGGGGGGAGASGAGGYAGDPSGCGGYTMRVGGGVVYGGGGCGAAGCGGRGGCGGAGG